MSEKDSPGSPAAIAREPLSGRRILVTRAEGQNEELGAELRALGAEVVSIPVLEFSPPSSWDAADAAIGRLQEYGAIAFTSVNGVRRFLDRLQERVGTCDVPAWPSGPRVFAVGPRTAAALRKSGAGVEEEPGEYRGEALAEAMLRALGTVEGMRILIPRAEVAGDALPGRLRAAGARVDVAPVYRTVVPERAGSAIAELFAERGVDAVTFTSASSVSHFAALLLRPGVSGERPPAGETPASMVIAAIGPTTAARAAELGFAVQVVPDRYTGAALAAALANWFHRSPTPK